MLTAATTGADEQHAGPRSTLPASLLLLRVLQRDRGSARTLPSPCTPTKPKRAEVRQAH